MLPKMDEGFTSRSVLRKYYKKERNEKMGNKLGKKKHSTKSVKLLKFSSKKRTDEYKISDHSTKPQQRKKGKEDNEERYKAKSQSSEKMNPEEETRRNYESDILDTKYVEENIPIDEKSMENDSKMNMTLKEETKRNYESDILDTKYVEENIPIDEKSMENDSKINMTLKEETRRNYESDILDTKYVEANIPVDKKSMENDSEINMTLKEEKKNVLIATETETLVSKFCEDITSVAFENVKYMMKSGEFKIKASQQLGNDQVQEQTSEIGLSSHHKNSENAAKVENESENRKSDFSLVESTTEKCNNDHVGLENNTELEATASNDIENDDNTMPAVNSGEMTLNNKSVELYDVTTTNISQCMLDETKQQSDLIGQFGDQLSRDILNVVMMKLSL